MLARCQALAPKHRFRFKNKLYSLDASTIDLCLSVFPWAKFRTTKGAIKLHVGLDHDGYLPAFVQITEGCVHEVNLARRLDLPGGSIVVFERRDLNALLRGDPPQPRISPLQTRLLLA